MRAAFAVWEGRISPVLDVSREAVILTIDDATVTSRRVECIDAPSPARKVDLLAKLGVDVLVCGAVSEALQRELSGSGMRVIGFVSGELDDVVATFLAGALPSAALSMPGCRCRRGRARAGRGAGRGYGRGRNGTN